MESLIVQGSWSSLSAQSNLICHCESSCAEALGWVEQDFVSCRRETRGSWNTNLIKIKAKPSVSRYLYCLLLAPLTWIYKPHTDFFAMEIPESGRSFWVKEFLERIEICCSAHCKASGGLGMATGCAGRAQLEFEAPVNDCKAAHLETKHLQNFFLSAFRDTWNLQITFCDHPDTISELCREWKPISGFKLCVLERTHHTLDTDLPFWTLGTLNTSWFQFVSSCCGKGRLYQVFKQCVQLQIMKPFHPAECRPEPRLGRERLYFVWGK